MKALRDIPYPLASPDPSIFESWSNEYDTVRLPKAVPVRQFIRRRTSSQVRYQGHNPSGVLERLSRSGRFAEAEEVRQELIGMNVRIRPSGTYYRAACDILRQRPWPPNRTELFTNWLSLLPNLADNKQWSHCGELKSALLFNSNRLDLETVAQFGIILSSKGYIRKVGATVLACLTRYAHPDVSSRILNEMIAADEDYKRNKLGLTSDSSTRQHKHTLKRLWSIAVRTHCTAGRPEVALQVAMRAHQHGFHLTQYTYQYLLGKLEADGLYQHAADARALSGCESLDVAKSRLEVEVVPTDEPILPVSPDQSRAVNRARILAILKRCSGSTLSVNAADIVPYFDLYKTDLRGSEMVLWLRTRAYRHSLTSASTVLLAELLHHHRRGQFTRVLWVFEKFFHLVGVPSEDIKLRLWKRHHYPPHMHINHRNRPVRITKTTSNLPSRLWPTPHHTSLVWSALVHLCETEEDLFTLYDLLLQCSAQFHHPHQRHSRGGGGDSKGDNSTPVAAPNDRYDAAHFLPFLIALTHLRGAPHGLRVLDDMQDRGVAPSAQILSAAAALQARHGEPAVALRMLEVVQDLLENEREEEEKGRGEQGERGDGESAKIQIQISQQQLLATYTGVLRGLLDRRAIAQAQQVAELLRQRFGYTEDGNSSSTSSTSGGVGRNVRTDVALRFLRRLETEGPGAEPEPLAEAEDEWGQRQYSYPFLKKRDREVGFSLRVLFCFVIRSPLSAAFPPLPFSMGARAPYPFCDTLLRFYVENSQASCFFSHCAGCQDSERGSFRADYLSLSIRPRHSIRESPRASLIYHLTGGGG